MAKTKPAKNGWVVAPPQVSGGDEPAPDELVDDDEWLGVIATGDYVGQQAEGVELSGVAVASGRWSGVILERLLATDVTFTDCDLAGFVVQADSSLRRVAFTRCRLSGAVFAGVRFHDVSFVDCAMDEVNVRMAQMERVSFEGCALTGADFYAAKVAQARATGCDMRGVALSKATLLDVDLRGSRLEDIVGADALRGATVDVGQVVGLARSLAAALEINVVETPPATPCASARGGCRVRARVRGRRRSWP